MSAGMPLPSPMPAMPPEVPMPCMPCMAFMRGSIAAMGAGAAMVDMPGEAGAALIAPGLAQALARAATDKAMIVRNAVMVNS